MSDYPTPTVMHDFQMANLIEAAKETFDSWLKRVVENGPRDVEAASQLAACSIRYNQLVDIQRSYLS